MRVLSNEVYKLMMRKTLYIFIVILFFLAIFFVLEAQQSNSFIIKNDSDAVVITAQNFPLDLLDSLAGFFIPVMMTILIAQIISGEYVDGTLKLPLLRQVSRTKLLLAKTGALALALAFIMISVMIFGYMLGLLNFEWGQKFVFKSITLSAGKGLLFTLLIYLLNILPLLAFSAIVSFFAIFIHNEGTVIGLGIGLLLISTIAEVTFDKIALYLPKDYFSLYDVLASVANMREAAVGYSFNLMYGAVFFLLSLYIFKKEDILS